VHGTEGCVTTVLIGDELHQIIFSDPVVSELNRCGIFGCDDVYTVDLSVWAIAVNDVVWLVDERDKPRDQGSCHHG
jgi:hypothetical protein